jgi:hypothetical protein
MVTLVANEPAVIYYTTNGTDPTISPTRVNYGGSLPVLRTTTLKFYAQDLAGHREAVNTETYTINDITPPATMASLSAGSYATPQVVTLTANEPAIIFYTTNGTEPLTSPSKNTYSGPLTVSISTLLKYYAQDIAGNNEAVKTATYIINPPVTTASPPAGTYASPQVVTLTANQPATIYYTTNGQVPTTSSQIYAGGINIATETTLKYFAKVSGGSSEAVKSARYFIKQNQAISFDALAEKRYGDSAFNLNATASSGLAVTYTSSNNAVATVSGNLVTIVGAGIATITASQGGDGNYNPAPVVSQTLTVNKAPATITLDNLNVIYDGTAKPVSTSPTPSGLLVAITYAGSATIPTNAGTYAVEATINEANYEGNASATLTIAKAFQTINFTELPAKMYGDPSIDLAATASSGLDISYISSNTSVATVSGSSLSIVGPGTTTISAIQNGNNNYNAAAIVYKTQTVNFLQLDNNGNSAFFTSFSLACNAIVSGSDATMRLVNGTLTEVVIFDRDYTITLGGGYSNAFAAHTGITVLRGSMTFQKGSVVIDGPISII